MDTKIKECLQKFKARQERREHPSGDFDKAGRWYPSDEEKQDCCSSIRGPSRRWPMSYMVHCRTLKHVANLMGVDLKEARKALKDLPYVLV
jgi:hypothetical protein